MKEVKNGVCDIAMADEEKISLEKALHYGEKTPASIQQEA